MSVNNSLIVKSILTEEFMFNNLTDGVANKKTILNRVKKMDQSQRKELLRDLDAVIKNVNVEPNPPSLNERAVCTLLLADDGKAPTDWCWLARVVIWVRNHLGRISSGTVMTKLEKAITDLNAKAVTPAIMHVKTELEAQAAALQAQINDRTKESNVRSVLRFVDKIRTKDVKGLFDADWGKLTAFLELETNLDLLHQGAQINEVKDFVNETKSNIIELIKNRDKYSYKSEVIGAISLQLRYMEVKLEDHLSAIRDEKKQLYKDKELVQKRLANYENNVKNADERKNSSVAKSQIGGAAAQIRILSEITDFIDGLTAKKASLPALIAYIKYSDSHLQAAPDALKNTQRFAEHFALLAKFAANDGSLNKQDLADVINPTLLTHSSHAELANRLGVFKSAPTGYSTDELKKQVINDIVAYWKIVFDQLKAEQNQRLEEGITKIQPKKNPAPAPAPVPTPVATQAPAPVPFLYPSAPAYTPVVSRSSALPAPFVIPAAASIDLKNLAADRRGVLSIARLNTVAINLQQVRENASSDYAYYRQINADRIDNGILQAVYGNFYWIMKDKLGTLADDYNWGGNVFTSGKTGSGAEPAIDRPLLNHYRVQAIVEALNGHFRKGENQNPPRS